MALFYRLCPEDSHTCTTRACLSNADAPCKQASAAPPVAPLPSSADPTAPRGQAVLNWCGSCGRRSDEPHHPNCAKRVTPVDTGDICLRSVDRAWSQFLDVLTGHAPSACCPTLDELQISPEESQ